jgi:hypothetical protein
MGHPLVATGSGVPCDSQPRQVFHGPGGLRVRHTPSATAPAWVALGLRLVQGASPCPVPPRPHRPQRHGGATCLRRLATVCALRRPGGTLRVPTLSSSRHARRPSQQRAGSWRHGGIPGGRGLSGSPVGSPGGGVVPGLRSCRWRRRPWKPRLAGARCQQGGPARRSVGASWCLIPRRPFAADGRGGVVPGVWCDRRAGGSPTGGGRRVQRRVPVPHLTRHWSGLGKRWRFFPAAHRQR